MSVCSGTRATADCQQWNHCVCERRVHFYPHCPGRAGCRRWKRQGRRFQPGREVRQGVCWFGFAMSMASWATTRGCRRYSLLLPFCRCMLSMTTSKSRVFVVIRAARFGALSGQQTPAQAERWSPQRSRTRRHDSWQNGSVPKNFEGHAIVVYGMVQKERWGTRGFRGEFFGGDFGGRAGWRCQAMGRFGSACCERLLNKSGKSELLELSPQWWDRDCAALELVLAGSWQYRMGNVLTDAPRYTELLMTEALIWWAQTLQSVGVGMRFAWRWLQGIARTLVSRSSRALRHVAGQLEVGACKEIVGSCWI